MKNYKCYMRSKRTGQTAPEMFIEAPDEQTARAEFLPQTRLAAFPKVWEAVIELR